VTAVVLYEHSTVEQALPDRTARALAAVAPDALTVAPAPRPGMWRISAGRYVGSVTVDGVRVLIRPKIRAENVFLFLGAGLPQAAWRSEAFDYATHGDLLPAVLAFFARTVETTLATGLLRSYRERLERLATVRGRIDFAGQLRRGALDLPVQCRFDDYTADIAENRYLRAGVRRALRFPQLPPADRRRLLRSLVAMEDAADTAPAPDAIDRIVFTRLNLHYRPMLRLAEVVLRHLSLVDIEGRRSASAFLVDMPDLFERFVTEQLTTRLRGRLLVDSQTDRRLDVGGRISLRPDLEFRLAAQVVGVADIKYKLTDDARARGDDYRQLLAYTVALGLDDGVLIYCRPTGGRTEGTATVVRSGTRLHIVAINAGGVPASVLTEIDALADAVVARCRPVRGS
jgi:5-methylcytosine-specific restriction enzyme subunit McrC